MEESANLGEIFEFFFFKRSVPARRKLFFKNLRRNRRTNFLKVKKIKGYLRLRIPDTNRYIRVRQTPAQRLAKKKLGRALGKATYLRKSYYKSPKLYMRRRY
jgi:hypothetical protein